LLDLPEVVTPGEIWHSWDKGEERMSVDAKVKEILLEILDIKEEDIVPTATFIDDLGATSIDLVEIFTAFENTFNVRIDSQGGGKVKTVQDAIDLVEGGLGEKGVAS
jgi:acyl carrier protein